MSVGKSSRDEHNNEKREINVLMIPALNKTPADLPRYFWWANAPPTDPGAKVRMRDIFLHVCAQTVLPGLIPSQPIGIGTRNQATVAM